VKANPGTTEYRTSRQINLMVQLQKLQFVCYLAFGTFPQFVVFAISTNSSSYCMLHLPTPCQYSRLPEPILAPPPMIKTPWLRRNIVPKPKILFTLTDSYNFLCHKSVNFLVLEKCVLPKFLFLGNCSNCQDAPVICLFQNCIHSFCTSHFLWPSMWQFLIIV